MPLFRYIKKFLKDYGFSLIVGSLLGISIILFGHEVYFSETSQIECDDPTSTIIIPDPNGDKPPFRAAAVIDHGDSGEIYSAYCTNDGWEVGFGYFSSLPLETQNEAMKQIPCQNPLISQKVEAGKHNGIIGIGWVCQ